MATDELRTPLGYSWAEMFTGVNVPRPGNGNGNGNQSDDMRRSIAPPKPSRPLKNI